VERVLVNPRPEQVLRIQRSRLGRNLVVSVSGDLDLATASLLKEALTSGTAPGDGLVADLSAVDFCGAAGVRVLLVAAERTRGHGGRFAVVASPALTRVFRLLGAEKSLNPMASVTDARRDLAEVPAQADPARTGGVRVDPVVAGSAHLLRLTGTVHDGTADDLLRSVREAVGGAVAGTPVVLDLRGLDTLTARGAGALLGSELRDRFDVRLLTRARGEVTRLLEIADPAGAVPRFTGLEAALTGRGEEAEVWPAQFEALTRALLGDTTVAAALRHVVDAAEHVVAGADLVSVTLQTPDGAYSTPVETGPMATALDQVQYSSGLGPCLSAAAPGAPDFVSSDDLRVEDRWPSFAAAAASHGYQAIMSTTLRPGGESPGLTGALNLYSRRPHGLTTADRHAALLLATHASLALAHATTAELAELDRAHLRRAISSRDVIGQAKGVLMARQGISAEEAFDLLRRTSQKLNVKLIEVATTLVGRQTDRDH
jgi:anti-anti-sigma factor